MLHQISSTFVRRLDFFIPLIAAVLAVLVALTIGAVFLIVLGADVSQVYGKLISGALGSTYSLTQTIGKATPLLLVALGICIAFRCNVLNIGVEGQVIVGGLASTAAALAFPSLPSPLLIVLSLLAGFAAGAVWAGIPGILKAWNGVNEILSTIMMNQVATYLLIVLLTGPMKDATADSTAANIIQTARIPEQAWLPAIVARTPFHLGAILAVIAAGLVFFFLWRTVAGYRIRAVGANPKAAAYAGISVKRITLLAMLLSGGLAGLAGGVEVLGVTHRALQDFTTGYGFSGIVVALFGGLHPLAAIPASLIFGGLLVSGSKLQSVGVSSAMVTVLQGLIVLCVVGSNELVRRWRQRPHNDSRAPEAENLPIKEPQAQEGFGR
ncbi:MAG TPA: ABC transporter permease [Aggregatilineales bacterium]|nr:ABC transporter permease [Aggregatilineales bacterium]